MKKSFIAVAAIMGLTGSVLFGGADVSEAATKANYISAAKAKQIALKAVNGTVVEIDFDHDDRRPHYEIDIINTQEEVELEVDAVTGKVKITDRDPVKKPTKAKSETKSTKLITQAKAIEIAKTKTNGKGSVTDIELDSDDGVRYYKIEIKHGKKEYEFEIHAVSGKILEFEVDHD